jgi:glycosyltransferase involved in cell wall biosynthesis
MKKFDFNNKKVVLILKVAVLGGAERQALGMAAFLLNNYNCTVQLIATHSNEQTDEFRTFASQCGIDTVYFFGTPSLTILNNFSILNLKKVYRAIRYLKMMKKEISKMKPDVIIPFLNSPSKIAALIFKSSGAKITFWHQLGLDTYTHDYLEKKAIKQTPFFIANADNGLNEFRNEYKIEEHKLYCLPQYVSIKRINVDKTETRNSFRIKKNAIVIGMIAHYRSEKYHQLLLEAFSKIYKKHSIHLLLLGNKDNNEATLAIHDNLVNCVDKLELSNFVTILSGVSVEKILNILDIGVLVSEIEGTPNVVMEYMLYGLPVIATQHDGCKRLLNDSPYLIPNSEEILISKMEILIQSEIERKKESELNSERIKKNDIKNYFDSLTTIINNHIQ